MTGMLGIDRRQCGQRAAGGNELEGRIGATGHARVFHLIHTEAMPQAVISRRDTMPGGFLKGLVFRRMHVKLTQERRSDGGNEFTALQSFLL